MIVPSPVKQKKCGGIAIAIRFSVVQSIKHAQILAPTTFNRFQLFILPEKFPVSRTQLRRHHKDYYREEIYAKFLGLFAPNVLRIGRELGSFQTQTAGVSLLTTF